MDRAMKRHLVDLANQMQERIKGSMSAVREIIGESDVVVAIWQDAREEDGVGLRLIKGHVVLHESAAGSSVRSVRMAAIPCESAEQAEALWMVEGE